MWRLNSSRVAVATGPAVWLEIEPPARRQRGGWPADPWESADLAVCMASSRSADTDPASGQLAGDDPDISLPAAASPRGDCERADLTKQGGFRYEVRLSAGQDASSLAEVLVEVVDLE